MLNWKVFLHNCSSAVRSLYIIPYRSFWNSVHSALHELSHWPVESWMIYVTWWLVCLSTWHVFLYSYCAHLRVGLALSLFLMLAFWRLAGVWRLSWAWYTELEPGPTRLCLAFGQQCRSGPFISSHQLTVLLPQTGTENCVAPALSDMDRSCPELSFSG